MLAHLEQRVGDGLGAWGRLLVPRRQPTEVSVGGGEPAHVEGGLGRLVPVLDRVLLDRVHDRRHLQVLLLTEAEHFGLAGDVYLDLVGWFDTRQRLRSLLEGAGLGPMPACP